jgi:hypothetical protein
MRHDFTSQFLQRHPHLSGYTLICVCEEINRITKAGIGVDGILRQALSIPKAEDYLVRVVERLQKQ